MTGEKNRRIALTALMLALAIALSYLESMVPSVGIPGIKLGLSNMAVMHCLFAVSPVTAIAVSALKSAFVLLTRGVTAGILSLCGGICSVAVMAVLVKLKATRGLMSVLGAVTHNLAQLAAASLILAMPAALWYAPVLVISGVIMGVITAYTLKVISPALASVGKRR